ncbi:MAG: hypothetical protein HY815_00045 [Candidatus Riflebacteria bacterium]|nr:hypothetical protein [Candidatus Riflebacteria bacterium]
MTDETDDLGPPVRPAGHGSSAGTVALGLGVLSQATALLLIRELLTISQSGELVVGASLAVWLVGWGAGCLLVGRAGLPVDPRTGWWGLGMLWLVAWGAILGMANARELFSLPPHSPLAPAPALGVATLILTVPALLAGGLFGLLTRGTDAASARLIYALESLGSLGVGVFLSTPLWERPGIAGTFAGLALAVVTLRWPIARAGAAGARDDPRGRGLVAMVALAALLGVVVWQTAALLQRPWARTQPQSRLVEQRELRQGPAAALELAGQTTIFLGGHPMNSWPARQEREAPVALAMLQHPRPGKVLLWGGRAPLFAAPARTLSAGQVIVLVEDPALLAFERAHLGGLAKELDDPAIRVVESELRAFLAASADTFDVMILDSPDPSTALANRIFTVEGLRLARHALAEGGVLAMPLGSSSSAGTLGPAFKERNLALMSTFKSVFGEVRAIPGEQEMWFARKPGKPGAGAPALTLSAGELAARLRARPGLAYLGADQIGECVPAFPGRRLEAIYAKAVPAPVNTDDRPAGYVLTNRAEAQTSESGVRWGQIGQGVLAVELAGVVVLLAVGLARMAPPARRPIVALGLMACVAMVVQVLLFLIFQTLFGSLYREIGLIMGLTLAGVSIGSSRLFERLPIVSRIRSLRALAAVAAVSAAAVAAVPHLTALGVGSTVLYVVVLGLTTWFGLLGGHAWARALEESPPSATLAPTAYAGDMVGAATGALATAGWLAPLLGVSTTALAAAGLALAAAVVAPRITGSAA